jgi:hypothetical protein
MSSYCHLSWTEQPGEVNRDRNGQAERERKDLLRVAILILDKVDFKLTLIK